MVPYKIYSSMTDVPIFLHISDIGNPRLDIKEDGVNVHIVDSIDEDETFALRDIHIFCNQITRHILKGSRSNSLKDKMSGELFREMSMRLLDHMDQELLKKNREKEELGLIYDKDFIKSINEHPKSK